MPPRLFVVAWLVAAHAAAPDSSEEDCGCHANRDDAFGIARTDAVDVPASPGNVFDAPQRLTFDDEVLARIPAGTATLGTDKPHFPVDGEGPAYSVTIPRDFWVDVFEVSNRRFARFVAETKFITEAEVFGWSFVHELAVPPNTLAKITQSVKGLEWWLPV
jgi:formylglycine-generating enzyme required for sulfatase activity